MYAGVLASGQSEGEARALAYTTLIIANLGLILTNRSWTRTVWQTLRTPNTALWWVLGGASIFLGLVLYVPFLRSLFQFDYVAAAQPAAVSGGRYLQRAVVRSLQNRAGSSKREITIGCEQDLNRSALVAELHHSNGGNRSDGNSIEQTFPTTPAARTLCLVAALALADRYRTRAGRRRHDPRRPDARRSSDAGESWSRWPPFRCSARRCCGWYAPCSITRRAKRPLTQS